MLLDIVVCFRYVWFKDGSELSTLSSSSIRFPSQGVMTIYPLTIFHAGYYQCRAWNMYGMAVSPTTVLQRADIGSYPSSDPHEETGLVEGSPHMIRCQPVKCFPAPSYTWQLAEVGTVDENPTRVVTDKRVQIDDEGMFDCQRVCLMIKVCMTMKVYTG